MEEGGVSEFCEIGGFNAEEKDSPITSAGGLKRTLNGGKGVRKVLGNLAVTKGSLDLNLFCGRDSRTSPFRPGKGRES